MPRQSMTLYQPNAIKLAADCLSWSVRTRKRKLQIARICADSFAGLRAIC